MQHMQKHGAPDVRNFADPVRNITLFGIEHGMKVADFGAGSGAYTLAIAAHLAHSGTVYAIDVQKDLLRRITTEARNRKLKNIEVIWADLEVSGSSKIRNHVVDVVIISNVLFQVPDKLAVLEEAKRIVKRNGRIILIDWSESFGGLGPHKDDVLTESNAKALVGTANLRIGEDFNAGAHHYGLVLTPR